MSSKTDPAPPAEPSSTKLPVEQTSTGLPAERTSANAPSSESTPPQTGTLHPLDQLRDIHLPPQPAIWPPAAGWWVIAGVIALVVVGIAALTRAWLARRRARLLIAEARQTLRSIESKFRHGAHSQEACADLSELVRRIALSTQPRGIVAGLSGSDWVEFLAQDSGRDDFREQALNVLTVAPYRAALGDDQLKLEFETTLDLVRSWLTGIARRKRLED